MEELSQSMGWPKGLTGKVFPGGAQAPYQGITKLETRQDQDTHTHRKWGRQSEHLKSSGSSV